MRFQMWSIFTALSGAAGLECDKGGIVADAAADANDSRGAGGPLRATAINQTVTKCYNLI